MCIHAEAESALERSNIGFTLYKQAGWLKEQQLPVLFYAGDIMLFVDKLGDMQRMADICEQGEALGLRFCVKKSFLMVFNDSNDHGVLIQDQEVPMVREYKYLCEWVNEGDRYLEVKEKPTIAKEKRKAVIMKQRAVWG